MINVYNTYLPQDCLNSLDLEMLWIFFYIYSSNIVQWCRDT